MPGARRRTFSQNVGYWAVKIADNIARDADTNIRLADAGEPPWV
jgi:G:T-mismatch repair DNA endonuclease (very short patch repair protein)